MKLEFNEAKFYPSMLNEEEKRAVLRSPLWPLAADINKVSGNRLFVASKLDMLVQDNVISRSKLYMCDKSGRNSLRLTYDDTTKTYLVSAWTCFLLNRGKDKYSIESKRSAYIVNSLKKDNAALLNTIINGTEQSTFYQTNKCFEEYTDQFEYKPKYDSALDVLDEYEALKHIFTDKYTQSDKARIKLPKLKDAYEKFRKKEEILNFNKQDLLDTFKEGVWVVGYNKLTDCMIVGAMRVTDDLKLMYDDEVPLRTCKTDFNSIPGWSNELIESLKFSLVLCKTSRETKGSVECVDPNGFIPAGDVVFKDSFSSTWSSVAPHISSWYNPQWFIAAR